MDSPFFKEPEITPEELKKKINEKQHEFIKAKLEYEELLERCRKMGHKVVEIGKGTFCEICGVFID